MRPTNIFAAVIFLLVVLSTSTPATANDELYGPGNNPVAMTLEETGGTFALKVQMAATRNCVYNYAALLQLEREVDGRWVPEGNFVPVQLGRFSRQGRSFRTAGTFAPLPGNPDFGPGIYRVRIAAQWQIGENGNNECVVNPFTHTEMPYTAFRVALPSTFSTVGKASIAALNSSKLEFQAELKTRTRLTFSQEFGSDRVVSFSEDYQPGTQVIRTNVPRDFRPGLPIKVHILNLETGNSTVATLFEPSQNVRLGVVNRASEDDPPQWQ